jgi:hypothetical protein
LLFRKSERDDVKHEQNAVVNGETFHFGAECALHRDRVYSYKLKNSEPQVFIFEYLLYYDDISSCTVWVYNNWTLFTVYEAMCTEY